MTSTGLVQGQYHLVNLTMQLKDMEEANLVCENVWCTLFCVEGHHTNECPTLGSYTMTGTPNLFLIGPQSKWCDICRQCGHIPPYFQIL
jgi:hypothetical protein